MNLSQIICAFTLSLLTLSVVQHTKADTPILLFTNDTAENSTEATLLDTDVNIFINGITARVIVNQKFKNISTEWQEATYMFPLPENSAVDHMKLIIGERIIEADIQERQQAKKTYIAAKQSGKKTSLLEQQRPNIFTTRIANIAPGEEISVRIEYQQEVAYDKGIFQLRFPSVVGPRYTPIQTIKEAAVTIGDDGFSQILPPGSIEISPIIPPTSQDKNCITINAKINAGIELASLESSYHDIIKKKISPGLWSARLEMDDTIADRDFVLSWKPKLGQEPKAAFFQHKQGEDHYALMMLVPGDELFKEGARLPKETVFVIDTSGSMGGASIRQARLALELAVKRLSVGDFFNIIEFDSNYTSLFQKSRAVTETTKQQAMAFVRGLVADGGTEMSAALLASLNNQQSLNRVRQVIFLTDGAIGNEHYLFSIIKEKLGKTRLFTVGIGSAPNSFFMKKAAEYGRGTFTYIGKVEEVSEKMQGLFTKLSSPVLTNLKVQWPENADAEMWPEKIPDLYQGEPLMIKAKLKSPQGTVSISGQTRDNLWNTSLNFSDQEKHEGIPQLWARQKIASLQDSIYEGANSGQVKSEITALAIKHHLVSKYTSLVAVDKTPVRPQEKSLISKKVRQNLPKGWDHYKTLGYPKTALRDDLNIGIGLLLLLLSAFLMIRHRGKMVA